MTKWKAWLTVAVGFMIGWYVAVLLFKQEPEPLAPIHVSKKVVPASVGQPKLSDKQPDRPHEADELPPLPPLEPLSPLSAPRQKP